MSGQDPDHTAASRLADLRANVLAVLAVTGLHEVAASAGLEVEEVEELVSDTAHADLFVLARLEVALGVPLWPVDDPS